MRQIDAVIFDMDGTLIRPLLDFQAIRAQLGIAAEDGILEAIARMDEPRRAIAEADLLAWELAAAEQSTLMDGAEELLGRIRRAGLKTALLTRNAAGAMRTVLARHGLSFEVAWSREDGPIKPEPDGVLAACERMNVPPNRAACVGDFRYDIQAANAAGCVSVLLMNDRCADFADQADHTIGSLGELADLLGI